MDKTIEAVLGGGEGEAGFFKEEKNEFIIIFRLKNPSSDDTQNAFERVLFISGIGYEVTDQDYDKVYVMHCKSIKQMENIIPAMEMVHGKRGYQKYNNNRK